MPRFHYVAKRGPQEMIEGALEADNRAAVLEHLTKLGYIPVRIQEGTAATAARLPAASRNAAQAGIERVPVRHVNQFTRLFASLVRSQVPMLRSLGILREQAASIQMKRILEVIEEDIRQGQTLSESLKRYPQVFPPLYVSLTHAGEIAGTLDTVLERLAIQADQDDALRGKIRGALAYPLFVGVVGMLTVVFLLTFVMPRLLKLFQGFGGRLPLPTRILMTITEWLRQGWVWALGAAVLLGALLLIKRIGPQGRLVLDRLSLKLPILGPMLCEVNLARFSRSFGLLLTHGIPILQALDVSLPVVTNCFIRRELDHLTITLKDGHALSAGLKDLSIMPPFVLHTIAVGEESGKVAEALTEVAQFYERELDRLLQVMASLLKPVMILLVGGLVGFIVMAVLLPIFEMNVIAR